MNTKNESRRNSQERGFTLVELMVALVIAAILIVGIYQLYQSTQNTYLAQDQLAELQQNARIGIEEMIREMRLAGYPAGVACDPYQADNSPGSTLFEFDADTDLNGIPERIQYAYDGVNKQIVRSSHTPAPPNPPCGAPVAFTDAEKQVVASGVDGLNLTFYDIKNEALAVPVASPQNILRIAINLTVAGTRAEEGTGTKRKVTINSDVKLRNQGLKGGGVCQKPSEPKNFLASDPKICNRAKLTWTANDAIDSVTNYRLYWGPAGSGIWTNTMDLGNVTSYTLAGLADKSSYDFALAAQSSCDVGPLSNTSTVALDDNIAPVVPAGADATASSSGNPQVDLSWNATQTLSGESPAKTYSSGDANYDVASYNIYRATSLSGPFSTPLASVSVPTTTYTDTSLIKCTIYYYKVTAVDQCGNQSAVSSSSAAYGNGSLSGTDSPTSNVTSTYAKDTTSPSDPTAFTAIAGGLYGSKYRIDLSWINPSQPDFSGTRIRYNSSKSACTSSNYPTSATSGGTLLSPDQTGQPGSSDSRKDDIYSNNTYYCFTAFAYDTCGNYSAGTQATAQARTCGDDPVGAPPAIDTNSLKLNELKVGQCDATGENRGIANLKWSYAFNQTSIPDLVGFNVYRTPSINAFNKSLIVGSDTYYLINESPVFFPSTQIPEYNDNVQNNPLNPGTTYKYVVTVVDCKGNESAPSQALEIKPGKIDRDTNVNVTLSGTKSKQYNIVNFGFKNTSASKMIFKDSNFTGQAVVTWTSISNNARLTKMVLDGTTLWEDTSNPPSQPTTCASGSCSTTVTFTGTKTLDALASGKTVNLTFKNSDGTTNVDMRGRTITIAPSYRNDTAAISNSSIPACFNDPAISISTALGAIVSGTTQNPPKDPNDPNLPVKPKKNGDAGVPPGLSVDATNPVTIISTVTPQQGTSISSVTIHYYADGSFSSAPDPTLFTNSVTMGCVSGMPPNCNTNQWTGNIPASPGNRIWFFVEAVDNKGNFSDDPSNATTSVFTAFTYDQKAAITVTFTASFVDPAADRRVQVNATAKDQSGNPVSGATMTIKIESETFSGTTDASGQFSATSTSSFATGPVSVQADATKSPGYADGICSTTLQETSTSVNCP